LRTLPDSSRIEQAVASAKATAKFQVSEETGVVAAIDHWLSNAQRDAVAGKSKPDKAEQAAAKSLDEIMQSLLTEARDVLDRLSAELNQPSAVPDNARAAQSDV